MIIWDKTDRVVKLERELKQRLTAKVEEIRMEVFDPSEYIFGYIAELPENEQVEEMLRRAA